MGWNLPAAFWTLKTAGSAPAGSPNRAERYMTQNQPWRPDRLLVPTKWSGSLKKSSCFLWMSKSLSHKFKLSLHNGVWTLEINVRFEGDQQWYLLAAPSNFVLCSVWEIFLPTSKPLRYYPVFSLKSFIFFTVRSIMQLELIFEYVIDKCQASCFHRDVINRLYSRRRAPRPRALRRLLCHQPGLPVKWVCSWALDCLGHLSTRVAILLCSNYLVAFIISPDT